MQWHKCPELAMYAWLTDCLQNGWKVGTMMYHVGYCQCGMNAVEEHSDLQAENEAYGCPLDAECLLNWCAWWLLLGPFLYLLDTSPANQCVWWQIWSWKWCCNYTISKWRCHAAAAWVHADSTFDVALHSAAINGRMLCEFLPKTGDERWDLVPSMATIGCGGDWSVLQRRQAMGQTWMHGGRGSRGLELWVTVGSKEVGGNDDGGVCFYR